MADLNSMIAQGAQFQAPVDPFAQYGKLQQLQQNQQANALNQMKMDEYVRGQQESNALRQFLPGLNETNRSQLLGYGAAGQGVFKALGEGDTQRRLAEQATSQAAVNKSNILKNAVAQTRDAVAGIDPTDASSYMALRESVLAQYPELAPHMPAAWDANVKQRLITTAASVLEGQKPAAQPTSIAEFERAQKDPQFMKFLQERAAAIRPPAAPRPEPAPRTQQITLSDGSLGIVNMDTGAITPSTLAGAPVKGRPSATAEKAALQRKQLNLDLDRAIIELTDATKDGGLIDKSTGSGAGRLIDLAAGFGGQAMPGAIAIGELQPIADMALKMVPRFEGPQSNADTTSYKQAAGQLADPTLPREIRKKAGRTVLRLMKDRKGQFASTAMEAEGVAPAPAAAAGGVVDFGSLR